ncbi:MAG TPA: hypothetical protein VFW42_02540 [Fluviicoccus sp.]|nr:hypothetical protein [Fluviicoccus sp.]
MTLFNLPDNEASIALGDNGDGVAVWRDPVTEAVRYSLKKGKAWTAARSLYVFNGGTTSDVHALIRPDGTAVAVFSAYQPGALSYCASGLRVVRCRLPGSAYARVATLSPGATAWTVQAMSPKGTQVSGTRVGADGHGNLTATWTIQTAAGQPAVIQSAYQLPGGQWAYRSVSGPVAPVGAPSLAVAPSGEATLVWQERTPSGLMPVTLKSLTMSASGNWAPVADDLAALPEPVSGLQVALDGAGTTSVVWNSRYSVMLMQRMPDASWQTEVLRAAPADLSTMAFGPSLAVNAAGDLLVAWSENEAGVLQVRALLRPVGGAELQGVWPGTSQPHASLAADRSRALVTWTDDGDGKAYAGGFVPGAAGWSEIPPKGLGMALWGSASAGACGNHGQAGVVWIAPTSREFVYRYAGASWLP